MDTRTEGGITMAARGRRQLRRVVLVLGLCLACGGPWASGVALAGAFEDGLDYFRAGHYRWALEKFQEAVSQSPYNPEWRRYLAETYEFLDDIPAAIEQYRYILRVAPKSGAGAAAREALAALGESTTARVEVPFRRTGTIILLPARVNGQDLGSFILDTGATFTTISRAAASSLALGGGEKIVRLTTASGTIEAPLTLLAEVQVGGAAARDVQAVIHDVPNLPASVVGLLGMSFLERFRMNLDLAAGLLVLETEP